RAGASRAQASELLLERLHGAAHSALELLDVELAGGHDTFLRSASASKLPRQPPRLAKLAAACSPVWKATAARRSRHHRGRCLAAQHLQKVAVLLDRENNYRKSIVASKGDGGPVHHLEVPGEDLRISQLVVAHRIAVLLWIGRIDAVHLRRLCQRLAVH